MNEKDIPQCCTPMPVKEETMQQLLLLLLFFAMDDKAREAFLKEADAPCYNAPTEI